MTLSQQIEFGPRRRGPRLSLWVLDKALGSFIQRGTLQLRLPDGTRRRYGTGAPEIAIAIRDDRTLRRIAFNPDLAVGEAYMDGTLTIEKGGLYGFLALCLSNAGTGAGCGLRAARGWVRRFVRPMLMHNPVGKAQRNVAHHYDLSDAFYELFLDPERQYSCAYFTSPQDSLEAAQERKMRHIAAKLALAPGQKVLDIGSGWGGLGLYLARAARVEATGVTLSVEQQRYASDRAAREGLAERARFQLRDYRHEPGRYDRIVSVGMFEHVGGRHYGEYFRKLASLLTEDGVALVHTIADSTGPGAPHPWIRKYIFPGGYIPALSEIAPAIERAGLVLTDIEVLRLHYAETLRIWRERFLARQAEAVALYDERFCRMWEFYLACCEAAFRHSGLVVFQLQLTRRVDSLPLSRDYMAAAEAAFSGTQERGVGSGTTAQVAAIPVEA
ncbi:MAG: methyltransferase domain-containing protein [Rhodobacteraceae bacterium]|nr:methyltransferase domain-containing protein [Paracoccaceae bacterium]